MSEKLVRDNIPDLVSSEQPGKVHFRTANLTERPSLLDKKLKEECNEFLENPCAEEAADILEVLMAIGSTSHLNMRLVDVISAFQSKRYVKGGISRFYVMDFPDKIERPKYDDWECQQCHRKERGGLGKPTICPTCGWNKWEQVSPLPIGAKLPEGL